MGPTTGRYGCRLLTGLLATVCLLTVGPAVLARTADGAEVLDAEGRLVEPAFDAALESAIDRVNAEGVAFVWLDADGDDRDAVALADDYVGELDQLGSRYQTVLVVLGGGYGASSITLEADRLNDALDAAFDGFSAGAMGRGLDAFTESLAGVPVGDTGTTIDSDSSPAGTSSSDSSSSDDSGGFGLGSFLIALLAAGGGFLAFRAWRHRRKAKRQAEVDLAEDRAEIKEQLENNADRVITLGDRVIAKGDQELIDLYEQASRTYQDVSQSIEGAATAEEIDDLDDRIDHAEWQFEVIEADLDGRPRPPEPEPDAPGSDPSQPPPPTGTPRGSPVPSPAPGGAEPSVATSPRTGRTYPRSTGRSSGGLGRGGLGGGLGGLGGILANIVLGGGLGGLGGSRRTQRRSGTSGPFGGSVPSRGGGSGGLGGGVLRRGGSSSRSSGSRRRTSSGGRSFGRSRSRGGRKL